MFLYFSKLLPLFFYPLGFACLLLLIALVTLQKRPRWARFTIALALILLLVGSNSWIAHWLVRSLEVQNIPTGELPPAEAIVVLGGTTKPELPPRPSVDFGEGGSRVLYAAQLYHKKLAPLIITSGGRIAWRIGGPPEAADMAAVLQQLGVPSEAIIQEPNSLNTHENAVNVQKILKAHAIQQVLLVTSATHMPRALLIFKHQGIAAIAAPTDFLVTNQDVQDMQSGPQALLLSLVPDTDRLQEFTRALKEYIGLAVYRLRGWIN